MTFGDLLTGLHGTPCPTDFAAQVLQSLYNMCQMQALVTALDIPWEAASHLLKHTRGNLFAAFKNELSAYHVNDKLVDELVWEYAAHR